MARQPLSPPIESPQTRGVNVTRSFSRYLRVINLSPRTQETYLEALGTSKPRSLSGAKRQDSHDADCLVQPVEKIRLVLARSAGRREAKKVSSREGKAAQLWGQFDRKALPRDLSAMGKQSPALLFTVWADI